MQIQSHTVSTVQNIQSESGSTRKPKSETDVMSPESKQVSYVQTHVRKPKVPMSKSKNPHVACCHAPGSLEIRAGRHFQYWGTGPRSPLSSKPEISPTVSETFLADITDLFKSINYRSTVYCLLCTVNINYVIMWIMWIISSNQIISNHIISYHHHHQSIKSTAYQLNYSCTACTVYCIPYNACHFTGTCRVKLLPNSPLPLIFGELRRKPSSPSSIRSALVRAWSWL